jgi:radical SAM superfamily enzyme YgiQ (UPF0313 family)
MHIVFVSSACEILAIEYLSTVLKQAGHLCSLCFDPQLFNDTFLYRKTLHKIFDYTEYIVEEVKSHKPDLVAFSVVSDNYPWAINLANSIKKALDVPIVFGGVHPTSVPEYVIQEQSVDYVVVGEGEEAIVDLCNNLNNMTICQSIPNVWAKRGTEIFSNDVRPLIQNLDMVPFPDKDIYYSRFPYFGDGYITLTSRGCVNKCTFCNNSLYKDKIYAGKGKYMRRRSPGNVLAELKQAKQQHQFVTVHFWDEIFISDKLWLHEFLEGYKQHINVPFTCCVHVNFIDDEVVALLKDANCWQAIMGVQTLDEELKRKILNRRETNEKVRNSIELLQRAGIFAICENILGLPTQTEDDMLNMLRFYNETRPQRLSVYFLRYFPRTKIIDIALEHNILTPEDVELLNRGLNSRSFMLGGTITEKKFAKLQTYLVILPVLPKWLNKFLISIKIYKILPELGTLAHSIARVLDRHKEYDVDAICLTRRYKEFMGKKMRNFFKTVLCFPLKLMNKQKTAFP